MAIMREGFSFSLEKKDNYFQLKIRDEKLNKSLTIDEQSERNVCKRLIKKISEDRVELLFLIGVGMGFWIEGLLSSPFVSKLIILEPDKTLYNLVSQLPPIKKLIESGKVEFFLAGEIDDFLVSMRSRYELLFFKRIEVYVNELMRRMYREDYNNLERRIGKALNTLVNDGLTIARHSLRWMGNFISNLKKLSDCYCLNSLYNRYEGTAVIVGAGPSVDDILKNTEIGKAYIISTDAALRTLYSSGYRPNLIVTLDPQPSVMYHFRGIPKRFLCNIPCAISLVSYRDVFDLFSERYVYFTHHPVSMLFDFDKLYGNVINRESVTSVAFELAARMGFRDIIFIGCDFSYPHYKTYSSKSFFYLYLISNSTRFSPAVSGEIEYLKRVLIFTRNDRNLPTSGKLLDYREELEKLMDDFEGSETRTFIFSPYLLRVDRSGSKNPFKGASFKIKNGFPYGLKKIESIIGYKSEIFKKIIETVCIRWRLIKKMDCPEEYLESHFLSLIGLEK